MRVSAHWTERKTGRVVATLLAVVVAIIVAGPASADGHRDAALEAVRVRDMPLALELLPAAIAEEQEPLEQAGLRLLLALMRQFNGQLDTAIAELKEVAVFAPDLVADFRAQGAVGLNAYAQLSDCYHEKADLRAALYWAETGLANAPSSKGFFTSSYFARKELADRGELDVGPLVMCRGAFVPSRMDATDQVILVPAGALGERLGASLRRDEAGRTVTFATEDAGSVAVCVGSREATVDGKVKSAPVASEVIEDGVWVPLRFVVEELGWKVYWDAPLRIAYVRKPAAGE